MNKAKALELLGGSVSSAAAAIGISPSAITQWPDELPARIADRVYAAIARKAFPNLEAEHDQAPATIAQEATNSVAGA
jgi:DNA-binding transcriptional regulator YdaS (Cro superfamily)